MRVLAAAKAQNHARGNPLLIGCTLRSLGLAVGRHLETAASRTAFALGSTCVVAQGLDLPIKEHVEAFWVQRLRMAGSTRRGNDASMQPQRRHRVSSFTGLMHPTQGHNSSCVGGVALWEVRLHAAAVAHGVLTIVWPSASWISFMK